MNVTGWPDNGEVAHATIFRPISGYGTVPHPIHAKWGKDARPSNGEDVIPPAFRERKGAAEICGSIKRCPMQCLTVPAEGRERRCQRRRSRTGQVPDNAALFEWVRVPMLHHVVKYIRDIYLNGQFKAALKEVDYYVEAIYQRLKEPPPDDTGIEWERAKADEKYEFCQCF